ncbi:hypothetical protein NHX12_000161 [Muraenolepis orangiensis]|uniref:Reverse transcriptase domain-containing protein n=1 Tax=Muraenolepis orangiensis TaxID=630683 RepID=A0A9Q0I2G7_9TELE|nr:hypothetical protein NHX12_000161 [Muraenolepis orangiensis]
MDASSRFFFGLERKNGQKRLIHSMRSDTGQILSESTDIRRHAVGFYSSLFQSELGEEQEVSHGFYEGLPKVEQESSAELEADVSLDELHTALQSMENGKAPGIDGLLVEFYKTMWSVMGEDLLMVLRDSLTGGQLPLSCRRAVLTLLPKKGDLMEIKNWRPVSLLCTEYKLLSKVLATRLREVMGQVIHRDQTYCVPDRLVSDNVFLIRDFLDISSALGLETGVISIDQEKAFDRVEHQYLWKTLEAFGFSPGLIAKIKALYSNIESVLKINGGLSAPFKIQRGIRQGCSLSGMLYSLAFEPLLHRLRAGISGVSVPGCITPFKLSAYADDLVIFINKQEDINVLVENVGRFALISSAKVNWGKSAALTVGKLSSRLILPGGLHWKKGGFKYLGVFLGDETFKSKNWENVLEKAQGRLKKWKWIVPNMS